MKCFACATLLLLKVEALSMDSLTIIESVLGLILATVLGAIVGFEREISMPISAIALTTWGLISFGSIPAL